MTQGRVRGDVQVVCQSKYLYMSVVDGILIRPKKKSDRISHNTVRNKEKQKDGHPTYMPNTSIAYLSLLPLFEMVYPRPRPLPEWGPPFHPPYRFQLHDLRQI